MVSDQALASYVESLLRQGGPAALTSVNGVVRQLEANLGMDLSHKVSFIHDQIDILLGPRYPLLNPAVTLNRFSQIPTPPSQFTHIPTCFTPQISQAAASVSVAVSAAAHQQHVNCSEYVAGPGTVQAPVIRPLAPCAKESPPVAAKRRGGPGGLSKVCGVSPELQTIVGEPTMARTEIVKKLWAYIRKNNLQDPSNKRKIICNEELRLVFETDSTDMFKMNKLLSKHIVSLEPTSSDSKRLKKSDREVGVPSETQTCQYPVVISDALAEFFGMGEREILQSVALRRVWDYIKAKHLEDPINNMILCDTKLQKLFGCESLFASGVSEMLAQHLFKQS